MTILFLSLNKDENYWVTKNRNYLKIFYYLHIQRKMLRDGELSQPMNWTHDARRLVGIKRHAHIATDHLIKLNYTRYLYLKNDISSTMLWWINRRDSYFDHYIIHGVQKLEYFKFCMWCRFFVFLACTTSFQILESLHK